MKKITTTLVMIGTLTLGLAQDASIDSQIETIGKASAQERVQLMNEFKKRLSQMNENDRSEAIDKLQAKVRTRTQTRTRTQEMQAKNTQEILQHQNMNQQQVGNQFMKTSGAGTNGASINNKMMGR